jgi:hypothetical protein
MAHSVKRPIAEGKPTGRTDDASERSDLLLLAPYHRAFQAFNRQVGHDNFAPVLLRQIQAGPTLASAYVKQSLRGIELEPVGQLVRLGDGGVSIRTPVGADNGAPYTVEHSRLIEQVTLTELSSHLTFVLTRASPHLK